MYFSTSILSLVTMTSFLVSSASAAFSASGNSNVVLYWGQNSAGSQQSLGEYCQSSAADMYVISFLYQFPKTALNIVGCDTTFSNGLLHCPNVAADIKACQAAGKKVLLSLGGAVGTYGFSNDDEATEYATTLWNMFGGGTADERPFDDAIIDGFDLDIENGNQVGYTALVKKLREHFNGGEYYIAAAPQCPYPDASVGDVLKNAHIDFAFVQFYNNYCGVDKPSNFNFNTWADYAANTSPNKNIKIYLGIPGGSSAAGSGYESVSSINNIVQGIGSHPAFGGIMMWDASQAFSNVDNGVSYAMAMKNSLSPGSSGSGGNAPAQIGSGGINVGSGSSSSAQASASQSSSSTSESIQSTVSTQLNQYTAPTSLSAPTSFAYLQSSSSIVSSQAFWASAASVSVDEAGAESSPPASDSPVSTSTPTANTPVSTPAPVSNTPVTSSVAAITSVVANANDIPNSPAAATANSGNGDSGNPGAVVSVTGDAGVTVIHYVTASAAAYVTKYATQYSTVYVNDNGPNQGKFANFIDLSGKSTISSDDSAAVVTSSAYQSSSSPSASSTTVTSIISSTINLSDSPVTSTISRSVISLASSETAPVSPSATTETADSVTDYVTVYSSDGVRFSKTVYVTATATHVVTQYVTVEARAPAATEYASPVLRARDVAGANVELSNKENVSVASVHVASATPSIKISSTVTTITGVDGLATSTIIPIAITEYASPTEAIQYAEPTESFESAPSSSAAARAGHVVINAGLDNSFFRRNLHPGAKFIH